MTKPLLALIALLLSFALPAQETMAFKDGKHAPATPSWDFICDNYALTGTAKIQIAKTDKGGWLKIAVGTTDPTFYIGGVVYVYLEDQTILVCTDKGLRESNGDQASAWYAFTAVEMAKLKTVNIESVRFNIRGKAKKFSSQTGNFTAVNKKTYFSVRDNKPDRHQTATAIATLYQKP